MNDWLHPQAPAETVRLCEEVSLLLSERGGAVTKHLAKLVIEKRYIELINYQFDYNDSCDYNDMVYARQVHALFAKQEWMDLGVDTRRVAEDKFWKMEEKCRDTNARISDLVGLPASVRAVIVAAKRKITMVLGRVPKLDRLNFSFGPGATTNVSARTASPRAKLAASLACSRESMSVVGGLLAEAPLWTALHSGMSEAQISNLKQMTEDQFGLLTLSVLEHSGKLTFVPKDARSMRAIIVEPILNGFAQKGIGSYMKGRMLRYAGIDLTDQRVNQRAAWRGSVDGRLATVDMSSASDTVARSVVHLLLPWEWYEFLASWVTSEVQTPDGPKEVEKFSSMGNGFTFELESLLFWSIAKACVELLNLDPFVCTFGDDVIIDAKAYGLFTEVLCHLGFIVNTEKSFWHGPFRESCGADWLRGNSIRPYYLKKVVSDQTLYSFHNFCIRNCEPALASLVMDWTKPDLRLFGPDGFGDGHLIGSYRDRKSVV